MLQFLVGVLLLASIAYADGWSDESGSVFGASPAVRILALSDWNNDQHVDLVTTADNQVIHILLWDSSNGSFIQSTTFCPMANMEFTNAIPADFNRDGIMDVAVLTLSGDILVMDGRDLGSAGQKVGHITMWQGAGANAPILSALDIVGSCGLPDIAVVDGNGKLLVFENAGDSENRDGCNFIGGNFSFKDRAVIFNSNANPTSLVSFDLRGVCSSDFVFAVDDPDVNKTRTFYSLTSASSIQTGDVTVRMLFSVPLTVSAPTVMDADGDGSMDFVFFACNDDASNQSSWSTFRPCPGGFTHMLFILNDLGGTSPCDGEECCSGHLFQYNSVSSFGGGGGAVPWLDLGALGCGPSLLVSDLDQFPALVRFGDYDRDGNNDYLIASPLGPVLLSKPYAGSPAVGGLSCGLVDPSLPNSVSHVPFFFDLNEDGRLDILATSFNASTVLRPVAIRNNIDMGDKYFFTATTLNGVKSPVAPYPAWGAIQIGAVHRFQWQDIDTNTKFASGSQQSMTQCQSLLLPRVHFGLGRTYSYIQNYATGFRVQQGPSGGDSAHHQWTSYLIPNSQVVALPYPIGDPSSWEIKLFLSPSKYQTLLLIALGTALSVIGIPIVVLKYQEMQADKREMGKMV
jgi:integrin alpha FG-GAP repeat containing protein 1